MNADRTGGDRTPTSVYPSILRDEECRSLLRYFESSEEDVATLPDLVEFVEEHGDQSADRERIAIGLHHRALPKLEAARVVEYDARNHDVRYAGHDHLDAWRDVLEGTDAALE